MSESLQIFTLMPRLMDEIGPIAKDRKNAGLNYRFRGVDDVLNAMHPAMVKLGISTEVKCHSLQSETTVEDTGAKKRLVFRVLLLMDVAFIATDGSRITHTAAGEGIDFASDKASNKAMSAAFKYACFLGLCIPVDDGTLADSDSTTRKIESPSTPTAPVIPTLSGDTVATPPKLIQGQIDEILSMAQAAELPPDVLQAVVAKYGVSKLSEMTLEMGQDLVRKLMPMQPVPSTVSPF